jgi:hypothetical protein
MGKQPYFTIVSLNPLVLQCSECPHRLDASHGGDAFAADIVRHVRDCHREATNQIRAAKRKMVPYPQSGPTLQFRCTECDWAFYIEHVLSDGVSFEERRKATAWFHSHTCSEFPRRVPRPPSKPFR